MESLDVCNAAHLTIYSRRTVVRWRRVYRPTLHSISRSSTWNWKVGHSPHAFVLPPYKALYTLYPSFWQLFSEMRPPRRFCLVRLYWCLKPSETVKIVEYGSLIYDERCEQRSDADYGREISSNWTCKAISDNCCNGFCTKLASKRR